MNDPTRIYATFPRRIKATIIDSVVVILFFAFLPVAVAQVTGTDSSLNGIMMFTALLLLEPILITYFGCTLGQHLLSIKVVMVSDGSRCPLLLSFLRYILKTVLGSISLMFMLFTQKHQAIHDRAVGTIVLLSEKKIQKDANFARFGEPENTLDDKFTYPSSMRRFAIFLFWFIIFYFVTGVAVQVLLLLLLPGYTLDTGKLPKYVEVILTVVYAVGMVLLAVLASRGHLRGAKRRKKTPTNSPS